MISYRDITFKDILVIKDVWERNRKYHQSISKHFKHLYADIVFEERINGFKNFDKDDIKISLAEDENNTLLGYCISTFTAFVGEPQTLHVIDEARAKGIGKELMERHIKWLKNKGCMTITITVSFENYNTIEFYKAMGFRENTIEMRLI